MTGSWRKNSWAPDYDVLDTEPVDPAGADTEDLVVRLAPPLLGDLVILGRDLP